MKTSHHHLAVVAWEEEAEEVEEEAEEVEKYLSALGQSPEAIALMKTGP